MTEPEPGPVVDMFANPDFEHEVDPDEGLEDRLMEEKLQEEREQEELLELLREWKAANA